MSLECLTLVLTDRCNLSCRYCYQNGRTTLRMPWDVARAGIDLAAWEGSPSVDVVFSGGEPLLEFDLIRRATLYADERDPGRKRLRSLISTNGLLIAPATADFLNEHGFWIQLSFDGMSEAQQYRGSGTFEVLDRMLDSLRLRHGDMFAHRLRVSMTIVPPTVRHLADSFRYLVEKGIQEIGMAPCITPFPGWRAESLGELDEQFSEIADISLRILASKGTVPLVNLRNARQEVSGKDRKRSKCIALTGRSATLDVDGQLYACPMFAKSYQEYPVGSKLARLAGLRIGNVGDPGVRGRYAAFAEALPQEDLWPFPEGFHASHGKCGDCECLDSCAVCPVSVWGAPENDGCRIPDFICAFNRTAAKYRARIPFIPEPDPIECLEKYLRARRGGDPC